MRWGHSVSLSPTRRQGAIHFSNRRTFSGPIKEEFQQRFAVLGVLLHTETMRQTRSSALTLGFLDSDGLRVHG